MPNLSCAVADCTSDARKRKRKPNEIAKMSKGFGFGAQSESVPRVDVMVCCRPEDAEVVQDH